MKIRSGSSRVLLWLAISLSGMAHADTVTYIYTDPQGTTLAEVDVSGKITATFEYRPYGSLALGSPSGGPGYTGHVGDQDTDFVYMQARYYDPVAGRFLSIDPKPPVAGNPFNFNRFAYVNNNPIENIDPDGTTCTKSSSGEYECHVDSNNGKFTDRQIQQVNQSYTNAVNKLNAHPDRVVPVSVNGVSFKAKAGDVVRGLASATVVTSAQSIGARARTEGGGLAATSDYFLNYTPRITIYRNAVTADRNGGTEHIAIDLARTFAHEGIHTLPRENALYKIYKADPLGWDVIHRDAYNAAGNALYDGGNK